MDKDKRKTHLEFEKNIAFLRKRAKKYVCIDKTLDERLIAVHALTPQVSKRLRPWYVYIKYENMYNDGTYYCEIAWFGKSIRIDFRKVCDAFVKLVRREITKDINTKTVKLIFDSAHLDEQGEPWHAIVPTELVVEVIRLFNTMTESDNAVASIARVYTREEKKKFADYKWRRKKYLQKKRSRHDRWSKIPVRKAFDVKHLT